MTSGSLYERIPAVSVSALDNVSQRYRLFFGFYIANPNKVIKLLH